MSLIIELSPYIVITTEKLKQIKEHNDPTTDTHLAITKKTIANMTGDEVDRLHNEVLMEKTGGNKTKAAKLKGMSPSGFNND